jgi:hypothetical protein
MGMRMRGDGRCNRECMHSPVSPEGRTETSTSPRAASTAQPVGALEQPEWIVDQGGSLAARQGCAAQRIGCSAVWADTSDRGRGFAVQKSCFSSPELESAPSPKWPTAACTRGVWRWDWRFGGGKVEEADEEDGDECLRFGGAMSCSRRRLG